MPIASKKIGFETRLPKKVFAPGEPIPIEFRLHNVRQIPITNIRIYLRKRAYYLNNISVYQFKTDVLSDFELGNLDELKDSDFSSYSLTLPLSTPPTSAFLNSPVYTYKIIIKVSTAGFNCCTKAEIPIYITNLNSC